jgi:surface protein
MSYTSLLFCVSVYLLLIISQQHFSIQNKYPMKIFKTIFLLLIIFLSFTPSATAQKDSTQFVTTWKTYSALHSMSSNDSSIHIRIDTAYNYNYDVDWDNDGVFDTIGVTTAITHQYSDTGTYTIRISGNFPRINFGSDFNYFIQDFEKLLSIDQWGTIAWQDLSSAFLYCVNMEYNATDIPDFTNVTSLDNLYKFCLKFNGDISNWDVSNVSNMSFMFQDATSFNQSLSNWDVSNVTSMIAMFDRATSFNQSLSNWDVSSVSMMQSMFANATSFNQSLSNWNVSNVTYMSSMFNNASSFDGNLSNWDVSNVYDMSGMFFGATSFNQSLLNWNVGNVVSMQYMFQNATSFNQSLSNWDVSNVSIMTLMFSNAASFNQSLSNWDVSNVTHMSYMFRDASSFNQGLSNWNVSNVFNMQSMFSGAISFNQDISNWNVSNVPNMASMFLGATSFNQNLSNWDVSNVSNMAYMFYNASNFNQNLSSWDITNVVNLTQTFDSSSLSLYNYDSLLISWESQNVQNNVNFGAAGLKFCLGDSARSTLISNNLWTFSGDTLDCTSVGVSENEFGENTTSLKIYPNPTNGIVSIEMDRLSKEEEILVYNIKGLLVKRYTPTFNSTSSQLNLMTLPAGVFIVRYGKEAEILILNKE